MSGFSRLFLADFAWALDSLNVKIYHENPKRRQLLQNTSSEPLTVKIVSKLTCNPNDRPDIGLPLGLC